MNKLLSVTEYCNKYNKDPGNVRRLLLSGRIKGEKIGNQWAINDEEKYPKDKRIKNREFINYRKKIRLNKNKDIMSALNKMSDEMRQEFGKQIIKIIIYGSYARNEQTPESDIDIAVLVEGKINTRQINYISSKYEEITDKILSVIDIDINKYNKYKNVMPFYTNINNEGIEI